LADILGDETNPGPDVQTDEQIEAWIRQNANTEYHPGCSCVMMPREKGGVLDASLKVYGTLNLRVIDSSVFPLSMSAHVSLPDSTRLGSRSSRTRSLWHRLMVLRRRLLSSSSTLRLLVPQTPRNQEAIRPNPGLKLTTMTLMVVLQEDCSPAQSSPLEPRWLPSSSAHSNCSAFLIY
jgi:GMC oxidoreductase